jgi:tRNA A-37 threonylcarbamoyl transferase component Bud32
MEKGQLIARGRTAEVYLWGDDCILKLFYHWVPDSWIAVEEVLSRKIANTDLPVPACYGLVEDGERKGILFQRLNGRTYLNIISKQMFSLTKYARQMAQIHMQILEHHDATLPSLKERLQTSISESKVLSGELRTFCLQILNELPDGDSICHFDFHPDQIMQTENGYYIIDWSAACRGNPCADIARTSYLLTMSGVGHLPKILQALIGVVRNKMYTVYISEIQRLNPAYDFASIEKWIIPIAAARLAENIEEENPAILSFLEKAYSKFQQ